MRRVAKRLLGGAAALVLLLLVGLLWLGARLAAPAAPIEPADPHPFRSAQAKERYRAFYDGWAARWPVPSETRMVETSQGRTFVRISGPADAPALVLLHGASTTSLAWAGNAELLAGHFRVFAVDNIYDAGRSVYTRHFTSADDFGDWLDELFDALALERVHLMGLSYGGWLACQYALRAPERVSRLVLLAPAATIVPLRGEFLLRGALASAVPHPHFSRSLMDWLLEDATQRPDTRAIVDDRAGHMFLAAESFRPKPTVPPTVVADDALRRLAVPTLFVVGENEKIYDPEEVLARLRRVAPRVETALIPNAGHDLTIVQAERVGGLVVAFLLRPR